MVILPDTSAWIEFLRRTESPVDLELTGAIDAGRPVVTTGPVAMELLSGARDDMGSGQILRLLARFPHLPADDPSDFEAAAAIYRACRRAGTTVRSRLDCLIAAVAMREGAAILHRDADFATIAAATDLVTVRLGDQSE